MTELEDLFPGVTQRVAELEKVGLGWLHERLVALEMAVGITTPNPPAAVAEADSPPPDGSGSAHIPPESSSPDPNPSQEAGGGEGLSPVAGGDTAADEGG